MSNLLSEQILPLTIPEKLQLIEDIWDSIDVDVDIEQIPLSEAQKQELDRRLAFYQDLKHQGSTWEDVKQKIIGNDV
jgi:putative addiction module component (TIGR02574 family)